MRDTLVIRSPDGRATATVCPDHGAQLASLIAPVRGIPRDVFYRRGSFWESIVDGGGLPYLFPVVGRHRLGEHAGRYRWQGQDFDMPMHGFSLTRRWPVVDAGPHHVEVRLCSDASTLALFPFPFEVRLCYRLENDGLFIRQFLDGRGGGFPLAAGFHPYFALSPEDVEGCEIEGYFEAVGTYDGTYTGVEHWEPAVPRMGVAALARGSRVVRVANSDAVHIRVHGEPWMTMMARGDGVPAFRYLQFYRSGADPFICIEPWMDLPNALNRGCPLVTGLSEATLALCWHG